MSVINKEDYDIEIYGINKYSVEDLISNNPEVSAVAWCNGYLMIISHIESDKFAECLVEKNRRVFAALDCAEMPKYQPTLTSEYNGKIHIMNHSNTKAFQRIVKYLQVKHIAEVTKGDKS